MEFLTINVIFIIVIFFVGIGGGTAAKYLASSNAAVPRLALGNAFAGGVFLGAGLLHMLADANENFAALLPTLDYPVPALIAGGAILLILGVDQLGRQHLQGQSTQGSTLLLIVLSLHSLIAGLSLGLERELTASLAIFFAIIAHKGAAGFSLGTALVGSGMSEPLRRNRLLIFATATPIGIGLGAYMTSTMAGRDAQMAEMVFDGLAAGTFLYIALMDICREAFADAYQRWGKLVLALQGFTVMAVVAIWT